MSSLEPKPVMAITLNRLSSQRERSAILDSVREAMAASGYQAVLVEDGAVAFDHTAELLEEQRTTNELLRDILQRMETIQTATK